MPNESDLSISVPDFGEVEVGSSKTAVITIQNKSDLIAKEIKVNLEASDVELFGVIPDMLSGGESFDLQLTWTPKVWNPDGLTGSIKASGVQVSR